MKKIGIVTHKTYCDCFNLPLFHFSPVCPISEGEQYSRGTLPLFLRLLAYAVDVLH